MNQRQSLDLAFHALSDGTRRDIVSMLSAEGELAAGVIASRFESAGPTISKHLRTLEGASLVKVRKAGRNRLYSATSDGFTMLDSWIDRHRKLWSGSLDRLADLLDQEMR